MNFSETFLKETAAICETLNVQDLERLAQELNLLRDRGGRLFVLGVGGSAANASHFVNDVRKLAGIEAYAPSDNVSELTARTNDEGWESVFVQWLKGSRLATRDALFILSVGGGDRDRNVSVNLVEAIDLGRQVGCRILGVVGRSTGHAARMGDCCVVVPERFPQRVTPHAEAFQSIVCHLLVSHPAVQRNEAKWEGLGR